MRPVTVSPFELTPLMPDRKNGPVLVRRKAFADERGAFARIFCAEALSGIGWPGPVAQINHSRTLKAGTLRGMQVSGSAEELGRLTTLAVVQSIFLIILADAFFTILFSRLGF